VSAASLSAGALWGAKKRKLLIGHTGITWENADVETAIKDIAGLGFHGFETFGNVLDTWETRGGLGAVLERYKIPLVSAYCSSNLIDPTKRTAEREKMMAWGKLLKKYGGRITVMGPNSIPRQGFDFAANKANIVAALNENAKALTDIGITPVLHQHTGTCIETREETYAVMEAVDTRFVKFGPDVGQLAKGGADPVKVVKDFLSVIEHMHLKDYNGGEHYLGYSALGQGKVKLDAILDLVEKKKKMAGLVMVELDSSRGMPMNGLEMAKIAKTYLEKQDCKFRT